MTPSGQTMGLDVRVGQFILASASPRRARLLEMLGLRFRVVPSDVSEVLDHRLPPVEHVLEIAGRKARCVARQVQDGLVLGADTVVFLDGDILEKPADPGDAVEMLSRLSGRTHRVYTGLVLIDAQTGRDLSDVAVTEVTLRTLSSGEIRSYVDTREPMDKAGSYAAQGRAAIFIESVSGCFYNVVGLPLACLWGLIGDMLGASPWALVTENGGAADFISARGSGT